jgi:hypothetical protein
MPNLQTTKSSISKYHNLGISNIHKYAFQSNSFIAIFLSSPLQPVEILAELRVDQDADQARSL